MLYIYIYIVDVNYISLNILEVGSTFFHVGFCCARGYRLVLQNVACRVRRQFEQPFEIDPKAVALLG